MKTDRRTESRESSVPQGWREGRVGRSAAAARTLRRRAFVSLAAMALLVTAPSCVDQEPTHDPLRIPWNRPDAPASTGGPITAATGGESLDPADSGIELSRPHAEDCVGSGCHDGMATGSGIHDRVAAANCHECHVAEGPEEDHHFVPVGTDGRLCRTCHPFGDRQEVTHAPFEQGQCLACHGPHGGDHENLIAVADTATLCGTCHEKEHSDEDDVVHGPYATGECLACHAPHQSGHAGLVRAESMDLCLDCHDEMLTANDGTVIANIALVLRDASFLHGAIREGTCQGCHLPHTSEHRKLLRGTFSTNFYESYDREHYALCFQCHDKALAEQEQTIRTGFRDGDRNLHALHVRQEKGRSCRACHEIHASNQPFHLRESVPFGGWTLPIEYRKRQNGGTCVSGCHQAESYDRTAVSQAAPAGAQGE